MFRLAPIESSKEKGLRFYLYASRVAEVFSIALDSVAAMLPEEHSEQDFWPNAPEHERGSWNGFAGYFKTDVEVDGFLASLTNGEGNV